ncbi:MAG: dipeptide ABC transporter ATP-binding protein [Hyphomicrobiales bacterium]|nr:dipeptide ABC transporter ATP-binding protein [Hyphomicrobiales bacterium]
MTEADAKALPAEGSVLLEATDIIKRFPVGRTLFGKPREWLHAVDGVSLSIKRGETVGLVGESGCGKSTFGRVMIRTLEPESGSLIFGGEDITHAAGERMRALRSRFQMVFQDPMGSLDPRMTVGESIAEPLVIADVGRSRERREKAREMLDLVGLGGDYADRYPHQFSGGQRQRICIARALVMRPEFIVADEPVSALDVSVRAQVINLFEDVQERFGLTYLFISHDLSVVRHVADKVVVMYLGKIVESGAARPLLDDPRHPYSEALLAAVPPARPQTVRRAALIKGDLPSPMNPPAGCRFHPRCPIAVERCRHEEPRLRPIDKDRHAACHLA